MSLASSLASRHGSHLRRFAILGATVVFAAATGCSSGSNSSSSHELVIGTIMPLSGPQTALSNSYRSMQSYFDALNAGGGINGLTVRLEVADDQFNAVNTPAAVRTLVDQKGARFLCGNQGTATFTAIAPYLKSKRIGSVPMTGESGLFTGETTGYQLLTPYELTGAALVRYATKELGLTKVAVAATDDGVGKPFRSGVLAELKALGLAPVGDVTFSAGATDQSPAAAKLQQSGAEIVLVNHVAPVVSQLARATQRLGFSPTWGLTYAALNKQVLELGGDAFDGGKVVFATPFPVSTAPALADYRNAMAKDNPSVDATDFLSVEGWIAGSVCADVIKRAATAGGVPGAGQLLDALAETSIDNDLVKGLTWTAEHRYGQRQLQIVSIKGGEFVTVSDFQPAPDIPLGEA